ncbi:MAG: succinyl-CoA synthetase beta subunit [Cycloclasticus pugetii]|jgi:succinyl-CoA synthetase beta subunit|uniref:Succinate--CoA ligase [ADP-forming] subunit beta n=1 Tax=Cycloclasticus pugetii TaxID=34068 RepID=A0AB33YZI1_9GAMM|nr:MULTISPECIES: ADP-forming succinate--CoA ligase subunit beta [Cycloclasticus]AFT66336.1 Succinyl-CoA ligase subunit beta [Cycloclasticus sp. P1]ATI04089.1 ADP-forming succinate--CoA ligase subunit beta [Cycloclasticus sp. PY97N]EPD12312.1 succinyl-CoA synthetase subunit beta [Cycloclasticus pugetii]MDF1830493.1 ADP-forming succinate--CoA ligase subunit beta [Cycloclasticus pugetii]PHR51531.1 MAG: ADP-forming succinate--CoA ligase subunit beta [Cycloclasticus sp.]
MNLHEYQAKQVFAEFGVPVPVGKPARSVKEAVNVAKELGGECWVVKAQVHAGGRGKAGGVKLCKGIDEVEAFSKKLLGSRLVTPQTDEEGLPIEMLIVEEVKPIDRELYISAVVDRGTKRIMFMASEAGGMDIEEVAEETPEKILLAAVDPVAGLQPYQARDIAFKMGLKGKQVGQLFKVMSGILAVFWAKDASQVEINPLIVNGDGDLVALDAKVNLDDNAAYRNADMVAMRDPSQEDEKEHAAQQHELNYITLNGSIGCMVNGAGLAMATMDLVKLEGGFPANFLDVGGGATAERVAEAFKLILSDDKVKVVLVNIFGGIVRCNLIAEGIIEAVKEVGVSVPVVVRLEGTNADQGRQLLKDSGLDIIAADDLTLAAKAAVKAAS